MISDSKTLLPLSCIDAVIYRSDVMLLSIFPPLVSTPFDLDKLHSSFVCLVEQDYPNLIGEFFIDPKTGVVNIEQTVVSRQKGATGIRFEVNPRHFMTTEQSIQEWSQDLMPSARGRNELICVKGMLLKDGGMAISIVVSHALFDAEALFTFITVWGQHYNGVLQEKRLVVNHDRHFFSSTGKPSTMQHPEFRVVGNQVDDGAQVSTEVPPATAIHLFHFTPTMMKRIKEVVTCDDKNDVESCEASYISTLDAITALFTILISRARGHGQDVRISTCVNARRRLEPPLPQNYAGNAMFHALSTYTHSELHAETGDFVRPATLKTLARRVRDSIRQCNDAYLRDVISFLTEQDNVAAVQTGLNFAFGTDILFTSWVHLGMYTANFQGVHPWYSCVPRLPGYDGFVIISEAQKGGTGLDVGVYLECSAMEKVKEMFANVSFLYEEAEVRGGSTQST